jgi:phosphoglycerate dehydrogenase-like enzyme
MKPVVALALKGAFYDTMFSPRDRQRLASLADVRNSPSVDAPSLEFLRTHLAAADLAITSWHSPRFDETILGGAPALRMVCHAGGSVRPIVSDALWSRGLRITSAAAAISHGVAEFCLGLIITGSKRAFWLGQATRDGHWKDAGVLHGGWHEIYQQKIGIVGAGFVGRRLASLLGAFSCEVCIYDPFATTERIRELGATKVDTLEELFSSCLVVSVNAPLTPETRHLVRGAHLELLKPGSLLINTARAQLIHPDELLAQLRTGRFVACLDVTEEEPPALDHPLRRLPNVWLTPHVAGAVAENRLRIGTMVVDEIERFAAGQPPVFEVTEESLKTMA